MKVIKDSKGQDIQVDDEDFDLVNGFNWSSNPLGYTSTPILIHRLIMNCPKDKVVDHIDGNPRNNQKSNLRICTFAQNTYNRKNMRHNQTGFKGVAREYKPGNGKKWKAIIGYDNKYHSLGWFDEPHQAALMYDFWATLLHGEYAQTNFKIVSHN